MKNTRPMSKLFLFAAMIPTCVPLAAAEPAIDFGTQIRPLLNKHCVSCHGSVRQAGEISFIYREQALASGDSGNPTIVPGKPHESELIARITSADEGERMPPGDEQREGLTPAEIALLTEWVKQGATWTDHWAFVKPRPQELPSQESTWPRTRIDHFVLARLKSERLAPSPAAPPEQWLRRASLDLTGLPPTDDAVRQFLADGDYAAATEHLLSSSHFGERWAQMWLDLVRYADTMGYENDRSRSVWPYRDWLIRAFNDDMPFDQFTIRQIAGDLLPQATIDDLIATTCQRNSQTNIEGGTDDEQFRVAAVIDRINTTWTVWHGMTFGCVQCHSHPYDPFRQEEYYRFMSFFNNSEDCDLNDDYPLLHYPLDELRREESFALATEIAALRSELNRPGQRLGTATRWSRPEPVSTTATHGTIRTAPDGSIRTGGTPRPDMRLDVSFPARPMTAIRLSISPHSDDPTRMPERGSVVTNFAATLILPDRGERELPIAEVFADSLTGPYDPMDSLEKGATGFGAYPKLFRSRWAVFVLAQPLTKAEGATVRISLENRASTTGLQLTPLRRFSIDTSDDSRWTELATNPDREQQWTEHARLVARQKAIPGVKTPVMRERGKEAARETWLFARGNWIDKQKVVTAGTPEILHPLAGDKADRAAMARWLVDPDNPLTARVFVNRIWAQLFGTGLVETLEDFGSSGQPPSHPRLLDDLAYRFRTEMKWSLKPLLRELVLSSTYRQDHRIGSEQLKADPRNRLLSRGPRTRLTAEMVRDQALAVSGLLDKTQFGPPVMPPQPDGVWEGAFNTKLKWKESDGGNRLRRGLYTFWKRTAPYPSFLIFDAPAREVCAPRRISTNTPLQALVTLNDPVYLECSRALARRMDRFGGQAPKDKLRFGYRAIALADPDTIILRELTSLYDDALAELESDFTKESRSLGEIPHRAALTLTANAILNLDTSLTK